MKQKLSMKTNKLPLPAGALAFALAVTLFAPRLLAANLIDPDADRIFKASCKYLADAKGFCVKVEVWRDVVLPTGEKLQTTRTLEVQEQRPDQLRIEVHSPHNSRGFWYEKKGSSGKLGSERGDDSMRHESKFAVSCIWSS